MTTAHGCCAPQSDVLYRLDRVTRHPRPGTHPAWRYPPASRPGTRPACPEWSGSGSASPVAPAGGGSPPPISSRACRAIRCKGRGSRACHSSSIAAMRLARRRVVPAIQPEIDQRPGHVHASGAPMSAAASAQAIPHPSAPPGRRHPSWPSARSAAIAAPAFWTWCAPGRRGGSRSSNPRWSSNTSRPCSVRVIQSCPWISSGAPISAARASITSRAASVWGPTTQATPGFRIPAFSPAICSIVSPEILLVVDRYRRDHGQLRAVHHVGRVQPPAKPDLQQGIVRRRPGEGEHAPRRW